MERALLEQCPFAVSMPGFEKSVEAEVGRVIERRSMLTSLTIKDFAIIDELDLMFGPGLNVMTGETGAGKTIIVEAIKLILGGRASTEVIRSGCERASVTAVFDATSLSPAAREILANAGVECDEELVVHRTVGTQGKGRIAVNGIPVTAAVLRAAMLAVVDVSSQHEHQVLLEESRHAAILDEVGGCLAEAEAYRESHRTYLDAAQRLAELEREQRTAVERLEFLKFQLQELEAVNVEAGEEVRIESERGRLKHAVLLKEKTASAEALLAGEEASVMGAINRASQLLEACAVYEPKVVVWREALDRAMSEVRDLSRELAAYAEAMNADPARLEELEDRLHRLKNLARKHAVSIDELVTRRESLEVDVARFSSFDDHLEQARRALEGLTQARRRSAEALHQARKRVSVEMGKCVSVELKSLSMAKAQFAAVAELRPENEWDESGPDTVAFLFSPNVGEPVRPLARIASGGELSRVTLAIKAALTRGAVGAATSIFDEVDTGIGGATASVVGRKLRDLGRDRQVIVITHHPQVAVFGDHHLRIAKALKAGRTVTFIEALKDAGRVSEIARMLGGDAVTDVAVRHAEELLAQAQA